MRVISAVSRLLSSCFDRIKFSFNLCFLNLCPCACVSLQTWLWALSSWFSLWHCLRACLSASSAWARCAFSRHFWEYCSDNTSSSLWMDCSSSLDSQTVTISTLRLWVYPMKGYKQGWKVVNLFRKCIRVTVLLLSEVLYKVIFKVCNFTLIEVSFFKHCTLLCFKSHHIIYTVLF